MSAPAQRSFAKGEIAPALFARTDQIAYATGLRTCRNMIVRRHGGASNRSGTGFIQESKNSAVTCRLARFVRDSTSIGDTYLIELGNGYARFYQNGGAIVTSGVSAWVNTTAYKVGDLVIQGGVTYYCIAAHTAATGTNKPGVDAGFAAKWYAQTGTIYEIPTPYATADLPDLQLSQKGDVITITRQGYAPRELQRYAHTKWILATIDFGPSIDAPTNLAASGGGAGTIRYWAVTAIKENTFEESLPTVISATNKVPSASAAVSLTWNAVPGAISYNVYRSTDGQTFGLINSAGGNPVASTDTSWSDSDETATSALANGWTAAPGQLRNPLAGITATIRAYDGKYTVVVDVTLIGGGDGTSRIVADGTLTYGRFDVYYSRDSEARILGGTSDVYSVEGAQHFTASGVSLTIDVPDNGYAALVIDVVPSVMPTVDGQTCTMNVNAAVDGAVNWLGGVSGFSDVGSAEDTSIAPPSEPTLFVAGSYPAANTNYQQRRVLANTTPDPDTVYASRIGSRASFTKSTPLQDDDMVQFAIEGQEVQAIKHLMDLGRLMVFATGGVYQCGSADDGSITPTTANPRQIDSNGVGRLPPIKVSDSALFVEGRGSQVRDLQPWQAGGSLGGYSGKDLTVFAAHLFDGYTIVDWAYAKTPHSIVWAVRSDGTLLGLTYLREHELWGWHRHDTDGTFENVCVIPEGKEDAVYVVVRRTINGATKRYIERFASRSFTDQKDAFFVDAGLSYDGRNVGTTTLVVSGGIGGVGAAADATWASDQLLTLTSNPGTLFVAGDVGGVFVLYDAGGAELRFTISVYLGAGTVQGLVSRTVPGELRGAPQLTWSRAVSSIGGLAHLEGKTLAIIGDGFVVASPNNSAYPLITVTGGIAALPAAYVRIHAGLAFMSDLEPLDLDSPGPRTSKDRKQLVGRVGVFTEATRGVWAGRADKPTAALPLNGLQEEKSRSTEAYGATPAPFTGYFEINFDNGWDNNGSFLVRQVDPLPMTILAVMPMGYLGGL